MFINMSYKVHDEKTSLMKLRPRDRFKLNKFILLLY